jgi:serine protease Do
MATRVVITHLSGAKANQVEQWPLESQDEISIGRDAASTIAFDPLRDDTVSRRHAVIRVKRGDVPSFKIADLGSGNGTMVNGVRLADPVDLLPGDTVQLGAGGPKFTFDLSPRPAPQAGRTRLMPAGPSAEPRPEAATATVIRPAPQTMPGAPTQPVKRGVGHETVQRMLSDQRKSQSRVWAYGLAGVLALIAITGGGLYYVHKQSTDTLQTDLNTKIDRNKQEVASQMGLTARDIVQKYGSATTYIEVQWRLYDKESGKPLYHKTFLLKDGSYVPAYVKLPSGTIVRWLTTEDENRTNVAIGFEGSGSGFVVTANGRSTVLTNKHVAAGWKVEFDLGPYEHEEGVLIEVDSKGDLQKSMFHPSEVAALRHWVPDEGGLLFDPKMPKPIDGGEHLFEGRNEQLDLRFPGQRVSYASRLIQASPDADVAMISLDTVQGVNSVELAQDDSVQAGDKLTVLGYPGISQQIIARTVSDERGRPAEHEELIPEPTVTEGVIAKISGQAQQRGTSTISGTLGDTYQLTDTATGAGNSGGPVFNAAGQVIALFTYSRVFGAERVTFAVPIRYGRDLLSPQRVN